MKNKYINNIIFLLTIAIFSIGQKLNAQCIQQLKFSDIYRVLPVYQMNETSYVLSGKKLYEVGLLDGTFPINNVPYIENGIWAQPVKLFNGFSFLFEENNEEWSLPRAKKISYNFHSADFFSEYHGLEIKRSDFIVEDECAMYITLAIGNSSSENRNIKLKCVADIDIRPSWRVEHMKDSEDLITYADNKFIAEDKSALAMFGSNHIASNHMVNGSSAALEYNLIINGKSSKSVTFLIVADNCKNENSKESICKDFDRLIKYKDDLFREKQSYYNACLLNSTRFSCSDVDIEEAFKCAKANILLNIRDNRPYYKRTFIGAGIPVYPRLFGTDFSFSVPGLLASGNVEITRNTLENALEYAREHWRGPHEVSSDGFIMGWDHIQISVQLVVDCWEYYLWTHDQSFLKSVYPTCVELLKKVTKEADIDRDGFLEGHGLMEEQDFKGDWEELSVAAYMYLALRNLSEMSRFMNDDMEYIELDKRASKFKRDFNKVWWNPEQNIWACSFDRAQDQTMSNFWSVIFPIKTGLSDSNNTSIALKNIKDKWVNDSWGMISRYIPKEDQSESGVGLVHNNICATAAFQNGEAELGLKLLKLTAKGVFGLNNSLLGLFPECQPQLCTNITQLWSYAPFLESIIQGFMGIRPISADHIIVQPNFPDSIGHAGIHNLHIGNNIFSLSWEREKNGRIYLRIDFTGNRDMLDIQLPEILKIKLEYNGR